MDQCRFKVTVNTMRRHQFKYIKIIKVKPTKFPENRMNYCENCSNQSYKQPLLCGKQTFTLSFIIFFLVYLLASSCSLNQFWFFSLIGLIDFQTIYFYTVFQCPYCAEKNTVFENKNINEDIFCRTEENLFKQFCSEMWRLV